MNTKMDRSGANTDGKTRNKIQPEMDKRNKTDIIGLKWNQSGLQNGHKWWIT